MLDLTPDPNIKTKMQVSVFNYVGGTCDLCLWKNSDCNPIVGVILLDTSEATFYCPECYKHLLVEAKCHLPMFPSDPSTAIHTVDVPLYMIARSCPLKLFYPKDSIDLGLYRLKRQKEREEVLRHSQGGVDHEV